MRSSYLISLIFLIVSNTAMATEEPKFKLIEQEGQFEIREYRSKIIAEVFVEGSMIEASSKGFRLIADYIFGNNKTTSGNAEKISMTAPVIIEEHSEKIAMTAPVSVAEEDKGWRVYFIMPEQYTLTTLPKPNNPQVNIREIDGKKIAVHQFSGIATESKFQDKFTSLSDWLTKKHLKAKGRPELARYNPPWTLPFFRRNEVMVELEQ
jgi:hypothetical protein